MLFLQYILKCKKDETIYKAFWAQKSNPVKNDWCMKIEKDLSEFKLDHFTLDQIGKMSKRLFKKFVKQSCKKKAFEDLMKEKEDLSKIKNNLYVSLEMQTYLTNKKMTLRQKKLFFKLKTRMTKVGFNFGRKVMCPLCQLHEDNQEGILDCIISPL